MLSRSTKILRAFRDELIDLAEDIAGSVATIRVGTADLGYGTGSGWFVSPGVIVTNHHVIAGERPSIKVRLRGGQVVPGELVGSDRRTDLAVIRVAATNIHPLQLRKATPHLGELCFAFGSPLGEYTESVTYGVVSGLGRRMPIEDGLSIENLLQTDAEINPGNSGGPLVDLDGDVLGINVSIRTDGRGVGFAVPAQTAATIIPELIEHGEILRPRLGVSLEVIDHSENGVEGERLRVANTTDDNPLHIGDVLLAVNSVQIRTRADLFDVMRRNLLGKDVVIDIMRQGDKTRLTVRFKSEQH